MNAAQRLAKRTFDVVVSGSALLALSPLFAVVAVLTKLDSPGPVFFIAQRCGQGRQPFDFYKFRTMVTDAHRRGSTMLTTAGDARVTRVGRYLRAFKIDELPQLLNVLKGDMSIVGPRPEVFDIVDHHYVDEWDEVLTVKPGLTCLLQVEVYPDFTAAHGDVDDPHAYYLEVDLPHKIRRDKEYARRASFLLDMKIIFQTAYCILFKSWAYVGRNKPSEKPTEASA